MKYRKIILTRRTLFAVVVLLIMTGSCSENKTSAGSSADSLVKLIITPTEIDFGSSQSVAYISVASNNIKPVLWVISANEPWVSIVEKKGVVSKKPHKIKIFVNRKNLTAGLKRAEIRVGFNGLRTIIPVSLFIASTSSVDVKGDVKDEVKPVDVKEKGSDVKISLPENTTINNFIDAGALETSTTTVTLNISAKDVQGVAAYYISDSDEKDRAPMDVERQAKWNWKTINENKHYKGIVSYNFKGNYPVGAEVYINVWFKNIVGGVSSVVQDSIVIAVQPNDLLQLNETSKSKQKKSVLLPLQSQQSPQQNGSSKRAGNIISMAQVGVPVNTMIAGSGNSSVGSQNSKKNNNTGTNTGDNNAQSETIVYEYGFENGYEGWWVENGQWEIGRTTVGPNNSCFQSLQCAGTVLSGPYSDYVEGRLISPAIAIPVLGDYKRVQFKFIHWYALHLNDLAKLQISVETSPSVWSAWKTLSVQSGFARRWKTSASGLSSYAGKTVRLSFYLYQPPDKAGVKEGWYIDDFSIEMVK